MTDDKAPTLDVSFLRDVADIVKNKTLFFIPFFGAYLAFILTKSDYLKESNPVIWLLVTAIFLASVRYIFLVSQLLWAIESSRLVFTFLNMGIEPWVDKEKDTAAMSQVMTLIPKMVAAEDWWYRRVMLLMYLASFTVLSDIFFGTYINEHIARLIAALLNETVAKAS